MLFPIPIGRRYFATTRGAKLNEVKCENCSVEFLYFVTRQLTGSGTSLLWLENERAQNTAHIDAELTLKNELTNAVDPVACPNCGWYQASMCELLRRLRFRIVLVIVLSSAFISLIASGLTSQQSETRSAMLRNIGIGIAAFGSVLAYIVSRLHNPNSDHPGHGASHAQKASQSTGIKKTAVIPMTESLPD